jgi:hypothetical protein
MIKRLMGYLKSEFIIKAILTKSFLYSLFLSPCDTLLYLDSFSKKDIIRYDPLTLFRNHETK